MKKAIKRIASFAIALTIVSAEASIIRTFSPKSVKIITAEAMTNEEKEANVNKIYSALKELGYSKSVICGVLGNIEQESGFDPTSHRNSKKTGNELYYGICQWATNGRKLNLIQFCDGKSIANIKNQIDFMKFELTVKPSSKLAYRTSDYTKCNDALKELSKLPDSEDTALAAGKQWMKLYEGVTNETWDGNNNRYKYTLKWWQKYNGNDPTPGPNNSLYTGKIYVNPYLTARTEPYLDAAKTGDKYYNEDTVNILSVQDGWGKTNLGWISLYYVRADVTKIFNDVTSRNNTDAIEFVYKNQLMIGKGSKKFDPTNTLTRAEFAQVLFNSMVNPKISGTVPFVDVKSSEWYYKAIAWAYSNGLASGYGADKYGNVEFRPNNPISREEVVQILYKYAKLRGYDSSLANNINYLDNKDDNKNNDISDWAMEAARWADKQRIVVTSYFRPKDKATREECADMIKRLLEPNYKNKR